MRYNTSIVGCHNTSIVVRIVGVGIVVSIVIHNTGIVVGIVGYKCHNTSIVWYCGKYCEIHHRYGGRLTPGGGLPATIPVL